MKVISQEGVEGASAFRKGGAVEVGLDEAAPKPTTAASTGLFGA